MASLRIAPQGLLRDPRRLALFAVLLVLGGVITGFLAVYDQADRSLALRQGPPAPVALQEFEPGRHIGPAREVTIRAEAAMAQPFRLDLRGSGRSVLVLPLLPLSERGAVQFSENGEAAATLDAQVARRISAPDAATVVPGVLLVDLDRRAATPADVWSLVKTPGAGSDGAVLEINGQVIDPGEFTLMIDGALSVQGLRLADDFVTVRPFRAGRLAALAEGVPVIDRGRYFFWVGSVVAFAALALSLIGFGPRDAREEVLKRERASRRGWAHTPHASAHFEPLPSQEEVNAEDEAETATGLAKRIIRRR